MTSSPSLDATTRDEASRRRSSTTRIRVALLALLGTTFVIHLLTLTTSPTVWQDEVQIIDYGRTMLPGSDQSYAVNLHPAGRPIRMLAYLGCLIQEIAYRLADGSMVGPRISTLLGATLAAFAAFEWLIAAGVTPWVAVVAGGCFLWDPLFVQSYRGARVDCWCMAFMLTALWAIRRACGGNGNSAWLIVAGMSVALGGLVWPSAILLLPLVLHEMLCATPLSAGNSGPGSQSGIAATARRVIVVGGSALVAIVILLLPFGSSVGVMLADITGGVTNSTVKAPGSLLGRLWDVPSYFARSPCLPLVALFGMAATKRISLVVAFLLAVGGVAATTPYIHRAVYLVPYFVAAFAFAADHAIKHCRRPRTMTVAVAVVSAMMLVWAGGMSLAARTVVALLEHDRRDPRLAERVVDSITDGRKGRVLLHSWNLYYPFRARGWAFWGPFDCRPLPVVEQALDYDLVVATEGDLPRELDDALRRRGYSVRFLKAETANTPHVVTAGATGYGPYVVYSRPGWAGVEDDPLGDTVPSHK